MKTLLAGIIGTMLLVGFASAAEDGPAAVDQAWMKAMLAQDASAVAALYAQDAVMYPPDAMEVRGREAIRKEYETLLQSFRVQEANVTQTHYETHGNTGMGWGRFTLTLVPKTGGQPTTMEGRFTEVSRKIAGKWYYAVDHASAPLPPPPAAAPPAK